MNHAHSGSVGEIDSTSPPLVSSVYDILKNADSVSIVDLVQACIDEAETSRASDIHIEPAEAEVVVRLRIDGILKTACTFSKSLLPEVISRIKVLSGLRTDEHQAAQDGRFKHIHVDTHHTSDVRVSITPTHYGENAVLRLLTDTASHYTLDTLGFTPAHIEKIRRAIQQPYGMVLVTGPTGSGKTTTLYALLKLLNTPDVSIVTIEDPIEYAIPGITQIPINMRTGLTFASGLRSIVRQDPNIIMVGEIRDPETAGIAVNTALTGHLLLSTLHTSDASAILPRLLDMGIDAYLVSSTVNVVIGQRLVRRICDHCKKKVSMTEGEMCNLERFFSTVDGRKLPNFSYTYVGTGCTYCDSSGYKGRIGIHEVLVVSSRLRELILNQASSVQIREEATKEGMVTMFEDGLAKVIDGHTTVSEVLRTVYE